MKTRKCARFSPALVAWTISTLFGLLSIQAFGKLETVCFIWPDREKYKTFPKAFRQCVSISRTFADVSRVVRTVPFIIALIINIILNIKITLRLRRPPPSENGNHQNQEMKRRITWMLMVNSFIFFCCLAPSHFVTLYVINFLKFPRIAPAIEDKLFLTAFMLFMFNSAINPILYGVASPSYRRGFLKAFGLSKHQIRPIEN